jgi:GntR family transcriptional regulator
MSGKLSKPSLTLQARQVIEALIYEGGMKPGDRLPTEQELAEQADIARTTVREAYKQLEQEGLVNAVHGRGRFVSELVSLVRGRPVTRFESISEMMRNLGYTVRNEVLSVEERAPTDEEALLLSRGQARTVVDLSRLRWHEDQPFVYSRNLFLSDRLGQVALSGVDWSQSLVALLASWGCEPVASVASIQASELPISVRDRVGQWADVPWLLVVETAVNCEGERVLWAQDYHRGDIFSFNVVRTRADGNLASRDDRLGWQVNGLLVAADTQGGSSDGL